MIPKSDKLSAHLHYFFTCYLPQHREVSPHTLSSYKQTFIHLLRYWKRIFPDCRDPALDRFQPGFLLEFLSYLEKELGNTASTRNSRLAALKSFFKMVELVDPRFQTQCRQILMIPAKRVHRWPLAYLEKNEVDAVFASVNSQTHDGYRDLCMLRSLYNTGARASELCNIGLDNLDLTNKHVLLYGKGKKERTVPLWDSTIAFIETYLRSERRTPLDRYRNFLFINQRGGPLTRSGLYSLCKRYLAEARAKAPTLAHKKRIHPVHVWRRTTATHLLLAGVDLTVIQEWLGHASIDTTCMYKGISVETKREALQKFYLFEKSRQQAKPEGFDWSLHPDLLEFLESL
jgi:site-specific recombinase XerD